MVSIQRLFWLVDFFFFFLIQRKFYMKAEKLTKVTLGPKEAPLSVTGLPSSSHGLPVSRYSFTEANEALGLHAEALTGRTTATGAQPRAAYRASPLSIPGLGRISRKEKGRSTHLCQPPELSNGGLASPWPPVQRGRNV